MSALHIALIERRPGSENLCVNPAHLPRSATYRADILGHAVAHLCKPCRRDWLRWWEESKDPEQVAA